MPSTQRSQDTNYQASQTIIECIGCGAKYTVSAGVVVGNCGFCATPFSASTQSMPATITTPAQPHNTSATTDTPIYHGEITIQKGTYAMRADEVVILRSKDAQHMIPKLMTGELILTNLNIIANNYKSKGFSGTKAYTSYCYPLSLIQVRDGQVQMSVRDDEEGCQISLSFMQNKEKATFKFNNEEELKQWTLSIFEVITGRKLNFDEIKTKKKRGYGSGTKGFITDVVGESILERLFGF